MPLRHDAGHAQADVGEGMAEIASVLQKIHFFAFDLPHSDASFVQAYPEETTEAFCACPTAVSTPEQLCISRPEREGLSGGIPLVLSDPEIPQTGGEIRRREVAEKDACQSARGKIGRTVGETMPTTVSLRQSDP